MIEQKFNENWKYWEEADSFALIWSVPDHAKTVTLPHDAMIEKPACEKSPNKGNTGFRDGAVYAYVKLFDVPESYRGQTMMLKFEGAYMNAFVYVNGDLAGKNPFGYTTFYVPLNGFVKYGQANEIRVIIRNGNMTNSRWYTGGGLYRDVYLLVSDLIYICPDGVMISTEDADEENAIVRVNTELTNRDYEYRDIFLETQIADRKGNIVAEEKQRITLFEHEKCSVTTRFAIEKPLLWDADRPNLYVCSSRIVEEIPPEEQHPEEKRILDEAVTNFGIRTLTVDAKNGLRVNRKTVKLRGACIHHDSGVLGAATYEDAQYRQVRLLKEAGFNAIRMAHHPMAQAMLRACDALGMYVMDEAFDMWNRCKADYDYSMYFAEWWEKDIEAMVRKDFSHPSVILYSVGNEIPEIGSRHGARICGRISEKIKSMDPTRFTLASVNGTFAAGDSVPEIMFDLNAEIAGEEREKVGTDTKIEGNVNDFMALMREHMGDIVKHRTITERLERAFAGTDIAGYNYMETRYETDGRQYPNRVMVGSETCVPDLAHNWEKVRKSGNLIGDFTWTGWDHLGEAGAGIPAYEWGEGGFSATYPAQLSYAGDMDLTGFRKPQSYFREIVYGLRKEPYIAVQNPYRYGKTQLPNPWILSDSKASWTYQGLRGKPVIVEVYSAGDTVELIKNGVSLGRKPAGEEAGFITYFETDYEPGELVAVTYEGTREVGRNRLKTADTPKKLKITTENGLKDGLTFVTIEVCDENGILHMEDAETIVIETDEHTKLLGFGSGNPKPSYNYDSTKTRTFNGRAFAVTKGNGFRIYLCER